VRRSPTWYGTCESGAPDASVRPCPNAAAHMYKTVSAAVSQTLALETRTKECPLLTPPDIFANKARARQTPGRVLVTRPPRTFVPTAPARGSNRLELPEPFMHADALR